ncbi:hypothetical protein KDK88_00790 [bacterium]|nr:hypothetical protein [bacterium]HPF36244.1 hypothetical protein [Candidatus Krumholzibacteria bacterium]HRX52013.1 hypothetical protein [Candidatus Krumholzibacteria bacterium]
MLKKIRNMFVRPDEPVAAPLTEDDHVRLDDAAWLLVDALRNLDPTLICQVRRHGGRRRVTLEPPNSELHGVCLLLDGEELSVVLGEHVHWCKTRAEDPESDAAHAAAVLGPLVRGREFVAVRRNDGRVVETGMGSLDAGVTGLWPEAMTRDRLHTRGEEVGRLTTDYQGWLGAVPEEIAAGLRNRPQSMSQVKLEEMVSGPLEPDGWNPED